MNGTEDIKEDVGQDPKDPLGLEAAYQKKTADSKSKNQKKTDGKDPLGLEAAYQKRAEELKKKNSQNQFSSQGSGSPSSDKKQTDQPSSTSESKSFGNGDATDFMFGRLFGTDEKPISGDNKKKVPSAVETLYQDPHADMMSYDPKSLFMRAEASRVYMTDEGTREKIQQRFNKLREDFYAGNLSAEDIDLLPGKVNGLSSDQVAQAINNKTKNLSEWTKASVNNNFKKATEALSEANKHIAELDKYFDYGGNQNDPKTKAEYERWKDWRDFYNHQIESHYNDRSQKAASKISSMLAQSFGDKSPYEIYESASSSFTPDVIKFGKAQGLPINYDPKTKTLTPASETAVRSAVDGYLNSNPDDIINYKTSGDLDAKKRNYPDIANRVVDYWNNYIPAMHEREKFTKNFIKENPEAKGVIEHGETLFNNLQKKMPDAIVQARGYADKAYLDINNRYFGKNGLITSGPIFQGIFKKWQDAFQKKEVPEDIAQKNIESEIKQDPVLSKLYKRQQKEAQTAQARANQIISNTIASEVSKVDPGIEVYEDGTYGIAGKTKAESQKLIKQYYDGMNKSVADFFKNRQEAMGQSANERAKSLGSFFGSLKEAMSNIEDGLYKPLFDHTGWGGDKLRMFQAQEHAEIPISKSDVAAGWNHIGLSSITNPDFYLAQLGSMMPIIAGGLVVSSLTEGAGMPNYIEWAANAGLMSGQMAMETYNQFSSGATDVNGNLITQEQAAKLASEVAANTYLPSLAFSVLGLGALSRTKSLTRPTVLGQIGKGAASAIAGAPPMAVQDYVTWAADMKAQGQDPDIYDYMQDPRFASALFGGAVATGMLHTASEMLNIAKGKSSFSQRMNNWKYLMANAGGEIQDNALFNLALSNERNGNGVAWRDATILRLTDPTLPEDEKDGLEKSLLYTTYLKGNVRKGLFNLNNVHGAYQAHNLAMADMYEDLSKQNEKTTNLAKVYSDMAKEYRENAKASMSGKGGFYFMIDKNGEPLFISDKSFEVLDANGKIEELKKKGLIKSIHKSDEPAFDAQYWLARKKEAAKESELKDEMSQFDAKAEALAEPEVKPDETKIVMQALRENEGELSGAAKMIYDAHSQNPDLHEGIVKEIISQAVDHPNAIKEQIGADAWEIIEPIVNEKRKIVEQEREQAKKADEIRANVEEKVSDLEEKKTEDVRKTRATMPLDFIPEESLEGKKTKARIKETGQMAEVDAKKKHDKIKSDYDILQKVLNCLGY